MTRTIQRTWRSWIFCGLLSICASMGWGETKGIQGPALEVSKAARIDLTTSGQPPAAASNEIAGFTIDTSDRLDVLTAYHCIYLASADWHTRMNWAGDVGGCLAGTVSQDFHDDTRRRINYFRAMAGLNSDITFDPVKNQKSQQAALIMSRNNGLSHYPIIEHPAWSCLTADGNEAAGKANISWSSGTFYSGPDAVDGQIEDAGGNNLPVGHRRWLLFPQAREMANGGIPGQGAYGSSAAIWVIGNFAPPAPTPSWASWPNPGYIPYSLVFPRWSFSLDGANFDNATVTMTRDGSPMPVLKIHPTPASPSSSIGDPSIVWEPNGVPTGPPPADTAYSVTINGITGAAQSSYTYDVIIMDPYDLGDTAQLAGPSEPPVGLDTTYTFPAIDGAVSYDVRLQAYGDTGWTEGGEAGAGSQLFDGTAASYPVALATGEARTGSYALHLAFDASALSDQWFELDRTLLPTASSQLTFHYTRRWCSVANDIVAEVSDDDGATWQPVWQVNGVCPIGQLSCSSTAWDTDWLPVSVSLGAHAAVPIRIRFAFRHNGWYFDGTSSVDGVFFDDISLSNSEERIQESTQTLGPGQTSFTVSPTTVGTHILALQPATACHVFPYGPPRILAAVPAPRTITLEPPEWLGGQWQLPFTVSGGAFTLYELQHWSEISSQWTTAPGSQYYAAPPRFIAPNTNDREIYRVKGSD